MLFLDEISIMPLALQTRLLRLLQEKSRSAGRQPQRASGMLICHPQPDPAGQRRNSVRDLLWRLREYALALPPLREWPALETFIATLWHDLGSASRRVALSDALLVHLSQLPWPGNVRQLPERPEGNAALADEGDTLTPNALPEGVSLPRLRRCREGTLGP